jgi:hypothetical protein
MPSIASASLTSARILRRPIGTARQRLYLNSADARLALLVLAAVAVLMFKHMVADANWQRDYLASQRTRMS